MLFVWLCMALVSGIGHLINVPWIVEKVSHFCAYNYVPGVFFAVFMFLFFHRLIFFSHIINYLATSMVGIYLIHDNDLLRSVIWEKISPNPSHLASPWVHMPVKVLIVFMICLLIDILRRMTVEKVFLKWYKKKCIEWEKIKEKTI